MKTLQHPLLPRHPRTFAAVALVVLLGGMGRCQELVVAPDNGTGFYDAGQAIRWNLELNGVDAPEAAFVLKRGGVKEIGRGQAVFTNGTSRIEAKLDEPGWLLVEVNVRPVDRAPIQALGGALVSCEKIQPARTRPEDFDAFWGAKLDELAAVPMKPEVVPARAGRTNVDYFRITLDNIRGSHIRGQLARPASGDKLPAMLIVQWAGVYPLQKSWVTDRAAEGWLVLNINAHDLPIDEPEDFYKDQSAGPLKDYPSVGNDDRETSYFLRMYLSCFRGAQFLTERRDWDGRTLVVTGGSQGGLQSLVTAALHPKVTAVMACVPAGCDLNGPEADRLPGWPMWYWNTKGKDELKVRETARYFDVVNFAPRVTCPVLIGVGLIDTVCPCPGVLAAANQLKGRREIVPLPLGEHGDKHGAHAPYYARFDAWNRTLVQGQPAPVK
jgi:cephalosporin-C deacetylase